uniref:Lipoprotein n=1 Tax=viral metagenome TaxID=1070528 RepID=A0A6H1ZGJ6_9ZZZZ
MKNLIALVIVAVVIVGCSGHCLKLSGNYAGVQGEFEYCIDKPASQNAGKPVLTSPGTTEKSMIISEKDAEKILQKVEPKSEVKMQGIPEKNPVSVMSRLGNFLNK